MFTVFAQLSPLHLLAAAVGLLLVIVHYQLAKRSFWAGAVVPTLWCGFILWYAASNEIDGPSAVLILVSLAVEVFCWLKARNSAEREMADQDGQRQITNALFG